MNSVKSAQEARRAALHPAQLRADRPSLVAAIGFVLLAASAVAGAAERETAGTATLSAPDGGEEIRAVASLPVRSVPVAQGEPVAKGKTLVIVEVEELEKDLADSRGILTSIQEEKRYRTSNSTVRSGGGGGSRNFEGPASSRDVELAQREAEAMQDLAELQTKIVTASPRAAEDGYVVRHFAQAGQKLKRRKPLLTFVEASNTVVTLELPAEALSSLQAGSELEIRSAADPQQSFRCRVQSIDSSRGVVVAQPLALPFLYLGVGSEVLIHVAN